MFLSRSIFELFGFEKPEITSSKTKPSSFCEIREFANSLRTAACYGIMTNLSNPEGLLACIVVFLCTCVHARRVKVLKPFLENVKDGPLGILHSAGIVGMRLQFQIFIFGLGLAAYILFAT